MSAKPDTPFQSFKCENLKKYKHLRPSVATKKLREDWEKTQEGKTENDARILAIESEPEEESEPDNKIHKVLFKPNLFTNDDMEKTKAPNEIIIDNIDKIFNWYKRQIKKGFEYEILNINLVFDMIFVEYIIKKKDFIIEHIIDPDDDLNYPLHIDRIDYYVSFKKYEIF